MAKGQVSISTTGKMAEVLADALDTFPDAETEAQALTRALFHWYHGRQENSKRGALAKLEERVALIESELAEMKQMLHQLLRRNNAPDH